MSQESIYNANVNVDLFDGSIYNANVNVDLFDGRKCNSDQWWSIDKCRYECIKRHVNEKYYV